MLQNLKNSESGMSSPHGTTNQHCTKAEVGQRCKGFVGNDLRAAVRGDERLDEPCVKGSAMEHGYDKGLDGNDL